MYCFKATLDEQGSKTLHHVKRFRNTKEIYETPILFRLFSSLSKDNTHKQKKLKELKIMENVKKTQFTSVEEYENSYRFRPSITHKRVIDGKTYIVKRYFTGDIDFEKSIKTLAKNNYYKKEL